ncbi:MAG: KUP/HAK/KT family potassium transporter, partial [Candidatus Saccharimonadales bacterium]
MAKSLLALGALGVVFGDIGTSPLYALLALFGLSGHHLTVNQANIYGVISLIVWSIVIVVCLKYIGSLMRENNDGEGGIMALTTLVKKAKINKRYSWGVMLIGIVGVSLFYGDSAITPAISVLSSIEGLKIITPNLQAFVVPVTMIILALLFALQRFGTNVIGKLFAPVMLIWFLVIGVAGAFKIYAYPGVLRALSPWTAIHFFASHPFLGFISMTIVVLAITGAEALYADMGHFGRGPIARAWFFVAFPALLLCYMGQGAVMLNSPAALASPFYALFPTSLLVPAVILATLATLIASQSVISGAFSLTRQAVQLGFLPNVVVRHTSDEESGQVYVPLVNGLLLV